MKLFKSYRPEYKDGEQMRDFIYVKDAVDVTLHFALQDAGAPGGLFNCGTGKARTWLDLARAVFAAMGRAPKIEFIEMPQQLQGKYQYFTEAKTREAARGGLYAARSHRLKTACAIMCRAISRSGMSEWNEAVCLGCYE